MLNATDVRHTGHELTVQLSNFTRGDLLRTEGMEAVTTEDVEAIPVEVEKPRSVEERRRLQMTFASKAGKLLMSSLECRADPRRYDGHPGSHP